MKKYRLHLPLYLILAIFVLLFCDIGNAQNITTLRSPKWSVGDWWIVECQIYDYREVVSGPREPGWSPRQAWRFQVDRIDSIEGQPYFVVSVRPVGDNSCPYWFRYWFRVSDRYVGRQELHHPRGVGTKLREIGPAVVTKNFSPTGSNPFFTGKFPTLPITVPLFEVGGGIALYSAAGGKYETSQESRDVEPPAVEEKVDPTLLPKIKTRLMNQNRLVTIRTSSNTSEHQYWNPELPWPVYGERFEKTNISRRYWLVEMGKD